MRKFFKFSFIFFFFLVFLLQLTQILYFNRGYFQEKYDVSYWKDRFEHSQWQLPLSKRIIGDDGLFSYIGYTLAKGEDPSRVNPETQPVAKYLIGFSISIFKNPVYYSITLGFLTLLVYFLLAKKILKNNLSAFIVSLILFLDPLFFSQFWKPWIDITQLFFLLLNILLISFLNKKNNNNYLFSLLCGLSLGLFAQTKLPVLLPVILVLEFALFFKNKFKKEFVLYIIGFLAGIFIPYLQYFLLGNSLIDFIKLQKYIWAFYQSSLLVTHFGAIWQSLLLGDFPNISGSGFTRIIEWWFLWPLAFLVSLPCILKLFTKKNKDLILKGIALFLLSELIIFALIPSYPRYLVIVIPFIYILSVYFIENYLHFKYKNFIYVLISLIALLNSFLFLIPKPEIVLNDFYYNFSKQYFQDIYQQDILKDNLNMNRNKFRFISRKTFQNAGIKNIEIKEIEKNIPAFSDKGWVKIEINYKTQDLGSFSEEKELQVVKKNSQWKIKWDWNILLNGFKPNYVVTTSLELGKRGSVLDANKKILVKDDIGYLILVNPEKINSKKEQDMLKTISKFTNVLPVRLQNAYLENNIPGEYVPLATIYRSIPDNEINILLAYPGVALTKYISRIYNEVALDSSSIGNTFYKECCTKIYSSYNYHGVKGVEREFDAILSGYSGGEILIKDNQGNVVKTVINKRSKNGQDVNLSL